MATHSYMEAHKRKHKKSYLCQKAKLLYNAALFRIRQIFTGWDKDSRTDNEKEAFAEVSLLQQTFHTVTLRN
jgi:putative transposase